MNTELRISKKDQKYGKILNTAIDSIDINSLLNFIETSLKSNFKFFITTPNPEILVEATKNKNLYKALSNSSLSIGDGVGIKFAFALQGKTNYKVLPGRIIFTYLLEWANKNKKKIYLLGATNSINKKALSVITKNFPNLYIDGSGDLILDKSANPVSEEYVLKQKDIVGRINRFMPDILFVAFGAPKQEIWVNNWIDNLRIGGAMVIGGTLDYYAGKAKLPPNFISKIGLEWSWRLFWEPKRIKRIFVAVFVFPFMVISERLSRH